MYIAHGINDKLRNINDNNNQPSIDKPNCNWYDSCGFVLIQIEP